jgi:large subunit ribosomal protein L10
MSKLLKQKIFEEFKQRYGAMRDCVLLKFEGLDVHTADQLRALLRKAGMRLNVVPNRLTSLLLKEMNFTVAEDLFTGPTAIVWGGGDAVAAPKILTDWLRTSKTKAVTIKGGFLGKKPMNAKQVKELANIPPRPVLLSMALGAAIAPMTSLLYGLTAHQSGFIALLDALMEKKGKAGEQ